MTPAGLAVRLKAQGEELGFSLVGIARPERSRHTAFYRSWLARGAHGEMAYLARPDAVARREELSRTMETVRSVVVVAHEYFGEDPPEARDPSRGVIARYARGRDYHKVLKKKLLRLLAWLREAEGLRVEGRAYVDTGPILERELASRAGLGWFGRNTMLIHPRRGSWFFLGCLLLDIELEPDAPFEEDRCGTCTRCLDACPTGALLGRDESGAPRIDARRCISYLTIEHRGPIPRELRPRIGNRIYGCDICQEVCPWNARFAEPAAEPAYAARGPAEAWRNGAGAAPGDPGTAAPGDPGTAAPSLIALMSMDADAWDAFSRGSPVRRAGYAGFKRNVAVALGNWGSPEAVPALARAQADPEPLVRRHAAWALGRIGSPDATEALRRGLEVERDAEVREEMELALDEATARRNG